MKKKGFTLVELLATIAILAVLISLSIVVYNRVKENVLNKELDNTISYIEAQARNYANDTNITVISVEDLILEGYIEPDDETDIYNPVTNESLNCYIVKSTYEDGKYTSVLDLELENNRGNDGTCTPYEKESNLIIGVSKNDENYEVADNNKWYKDNVYLVGMQRNSDNSYKQVNDESKYSFEWKSNPTRYSELIKAIQKKVGATQDGWIGPNTIRKMQKYFGTVQDGCISNPSDVVKAFQRWLNKQ